MDQRVEIESKFPEIVLLRFMEDQTSHQTVKWKKPRSWQVSKNVKVLFLYGVTIYDGQIREVMTKRPDLKIVFIEDDPARLKSYLLAKESELLQEASVDLKIQMPHVEKEKFLEDVAYQYGSRQIAFIDLKGDEKTFEEVRRLLFRKAVLADAIHKELLFYPKLFRNLQKNFYKLQGAFDIGRMRGNFQKVPAVICGAGPSLSNFQKELKMLSDRALILAGGSTIVSLSQMGIHPHLGFALDPNPEEYTRLRHHSSFDMPLVFANRLQSDVFRFFNGPFGYAVTGTGGFLEKWVEEELGIEDPKIYESLSDEALSVTTIALQTAIYFGCDPIYLVGVDLKYSDHKRYSGDIASVMQLALEESEQVSSAPIREGNDVTAMRFLMERDVIDQVAKVNPDTHLFDGSCQGLVFHHLKQKKLDPKDFLQVRDIAGMLWNQISKATMDITEKQIQGVFLKLRESLQRCLDAIDNFLEEMEKAEKFEETAKMILYQHDLEEEIAYKVLLSGTFHALNIEFSHLCQTEDPKSNWQARKNIFKKMHSTVADFSALC